MLPRRVIDSITTADGRRLALAQRGEAFFLEMGGEELMSSQKHGSEEALATEVIGRLPAGLGGAPRVLVGGLGMGFTLRATLDALAGRASARVVVAEVFAAVVGWNHGPLAGLAGEPLVDGRVEVRVEDVATTIRGGGFDAILLDVDNGPDAFTLASNEGLYTPGGLAQIRAALTAGGVLGIWSAFDDQGFASRLARAGLAVEALRVRPRGGKGRRLHTLFIGRRAG
ncbi:MAG: hypothetical protein IPK80_03590 [Nannocystis sp.]|nr:hypothetical protein [Nannocystis sp.]